MLSLPPLHTVADRRPLLPAFLAAVLFAALLWWIKVTETLFGWDFTGLGVYPREVKGLAGILFAPFLHGSFQHLFANTLPILILGTALLYGYPKSRWWTIVLIWLGSGVGVWLTGRESYHIGASGLTHGLMFFIFTAGIFRRDRRSIAMSMLVFFLYGSMVLTIFPREPEISFEYHFWGAMAGVVCAVLFRNLDPRPQIKRYRWEDEPEEEDDPVIGDAWKYPPDDPGDRPH